MYFQHRAYWFPKDAEQADRYQDAYQVNPSQGVAAIADGASSTLFSSNWAQLLTRAAAAFPPDVCDGNSLYPWLAERRSEWAASFDEQTLTWHQKPKLKQGAAATLMWIELHPPDAQQNEPPGTLALRCFAVGDCCLFHVRDDQVLRAFPLENSAAFDTHPAVVRSIETPAAGHVAFDTLEDRCLPGDLLVLSTDALAAWALAQLESGDNPGWESYWSLSEAAWAQRVIKLRQANQMRYDDTTALLLRVEQQLVIQERPRQQQSKAGLIDELSDTVQDLADKADQWLSKTFGGSKRKR